MLPALQHKAHCQRSERKRRPLGSRCWVPPGLSSWGFWQVAQALFGSIPPLSSPSCPTCLQGLQRANRCRRAFEISMPYKFKVFGNGFLINLPTLSFWKRQKSQIHSRFNLPWYFLSRWLKSCLPCVLCTSIQRLTPSLVNPRHSDVPGGRVWLPVVPPKVLLRGGRRGTFPRPRYSSISASFGGHTRLRPAYLPEAERIPTLGSWALALRV